MTRRSKNYFLSDSISDCVCGRRRGQHRYGDEKCPNPKWKVGNGQPQWLDWERYTPTIDTQAVHRTWAREGKGAS